MRGHPSTTSFAGGLASLGTDEAGPAYHRRFGDWPDARLIEAVAEVIATPKAAPADSFVLHAPLELLARARLLRLLDGEAKERARAGLVGLAAAYLAAGDPVPEPAAVEPSSAGAAVAALLGALDAGDLDDVDRWAAWLGRNVPPAHVGRALAGPVAPSLAAAGHASILLTLLPRVAGTTAVTGALVRGPARELARHPDWRLRWFEGPVDRGESSPLLHALLDVPMLGIPGSDFIFPIMDQVERTGTAARLLSGLVTGHVDPTTVARHLSRVAAWSMLQEPPDHAAYGWTHCLTMPQAVMALAGRGTPARVAAVVAATHVVGFRAALGQRALVPRYEPEPPTTTDLGESIVAGPEVAAAWVWHAAAAHEQGVAAELAARASAHHDAHLVKYTLACIDAADEDTAARRLYLAAAAYLSAWWARHPGD